MTRRSGLGRGLDALLPEQHTVDLTEGSALLTLPVDRIGINPRQPRVNFDAESLDELGHSIEQLGLLQPILVREASSGEYELVAGERRLRAAKQIGLETVPALVVETDGVGSLERALVENIHRSDLNPLEEAAAYRQLIQEGGVTQEALAQRLGVSRVAVTNALRLLELPVPVQHFIVDGRLTAGHGRALLGVVGPFQERLARRAAQERLSVRETEELVRRYQAISSAGTRDSTAAARRPPQLTEAQRRLADHLQARVRVELGKRKGKITVDFTSLEELERVMAIILGDATGGRASTASPD